MGILPASNCRGELPWIGTCATFSLYGQPQPSGQPRPRLVRVLASLVRLRQKRRTVLGLDQRVRLGHNAHPVPRSQDRSRLLWFAGDGADAVGPGPVRSIPAECGLAASSRGHGQARGARSHRQDAYHLGFAEPGEASSKADKTLREEWASFAKRSGFDREARVAWRNDAINAMDGRCQGFPQHITSGCRALCGTLLERGGEFSPQNNLLGAVAERGAHLAKGDRAQ